MRCNIGRGMSRGYHSCGNQKPHVAERQLAWLPSCRNSVNCLHMNNPLLITAPHSLSESKSGVLESTPGSGDHNVVFARHSGLSVYQGFLYMEPALRDHHVSDHQTLEFKRMGDPGQKVGQLVSRFLIQLRLTVLISLSTVTRPQSLVSHNNKQDEVH